MANDDYALVVGITRYPGLTNLDGPEADATAFADWLRGPNGGSVPDANITQLLSSQFAPAVDPPQAQPIVTQIESALEAHITRAEANGGRAGRRLYLYFAGHGFSPDVEEVAVLMANAARKRTGHHIPGRMYAQWFQMAGYFDEIVLFMDCCREPKLKPPLHVPPWDERIGAKPAEVFFGFATCWSKGAREQAYNGGSVRGVFTTGLLEGLNGGIRPNAQGQVTASMVEGFVRNYLQKISDSTEAQVPEFDYATPDRFVLLEGLAPKTYPVRVSRSDQGNLAEITLTDGAGVVIAGQVADSRVVYSLPSGLYKAFIPTKPPALFEVLAEGGAQDVVIAA